MNLSKQSNLVLVVVLCAVLGVMVNSSRGSSSRGSEESTIQDVSSLDRRLSLLEQRFYSVESSVSRLQQLVAAQRPPVSQPSTNDREMSLIREEIQRLSLRMAEVECGLVKLDERTTSTSRRNANGKSSDPCRLNPETAVRLSTRP
jgi:predicted RNase H-like nuclease (RuvC/YqgF family)